MYTDVIKAEVVESAFTLGTLKIDAERAVNKYRYIVNVFVLGVFNEDFSSTDNKLKK